ncbi:putative tRNA pseudouridine synthase Pus10 [Dendrobium catenatum]|uniref:tRNA pseudouridine(55) synthase n=1 Tax=Dendrobium catenatum TaxID=906689 RepID=A0A2I0X747_9ASPA|nr:putative tRNA pseudouridine synthase Pus10 [Dendrobium catenatum]PKU83749.1 tRNA pseudouridine synthase 10 [Dendrobium catenatum]
MAGEMADDARSIFSRAALSLPPPHVSLDLLSSGVCVRCIFRLFGVHGDFYSCPFLTGPELHYFLKLQNGCQAGISENGHSSFGLHQCSEESDFNQKYCSICLGILQFPQDLYLGEGTSKDNFSIDVFVEKIAESIKIANHQIDGFFLEVSIPPVIVANERSIWSYMKKKYDSEAWFKNKALYNQISLKDALRLSITESLENKLSVKSGANSFHICLAYTNSEASLSLQNSLRKVQSSNRRRTEKENVVKVVDQCGNGQLDSREQLCSKSDAAILKELSSLDDHTFCDLFELPPKKASNSCKLMITCYRMPVFIGGRYLKFSRKVSQTLWIIDDERMGEASVEEIVGTPALEICRGDSYKFHAAGREDIDVRMLGSGRPFLVEVSNARFLPSMVDVVQMAVKINNSEKKYVMVRNLEVVGSEAWNLMRVGEAEKQKQYAALVWISRPLTDEDLQSISSVDNMEISQSTPIRVLHRRSPLERKRIIHWMKIEKIVGSSQFFLLHLCTQAGTYIKEFVHGDLGRTFPSIGSLLACRVEILQLDVTDVKMDVFI